jgi:hypothetical protein
MLLSVPVTVTWVALLAVTVRLDEAPAVIEAGLAVMLTVGTAGLSPPPVAATVVVPQPARDIDKAMTPQSASREAKQPIEE